MSRNHATGPGDDVPEPPVAPVNPGAWDTRSWTLMSAAPGGVPQVTGGVPQVSWPEAGAHDDAPTLDAAVMPDAALREWTEDGEPVERLTKARTATGREAPGGMAPGGPGRTGPSGRAGTRGGASARPTASAAAGVGTRRAASGARGDSSGAGASRGGTPTGRTGAGTREGGPAGARPAKRSPGGTGAAPAPAERSADPVRALMRQHRELCERAVDPLEIAAGLEAYGVTDRAAARFRHRDVFSLAEELFVRVPRAEARPAPRPAPGPAPRRRTAARLLLPLLPGTLCAASFVAAYLLPAVPPPARTALVVAGALAALVSLRYALRGLPGTRTTALWVCWLLGYALYGDWLLGQGLDGGPRPGRPTVAPPGVPLALALGVAPAIWCARRFAVRARKRLAASRSLDGFAAAARRSLAASVALFAAALAAVQGAGHLAVTALGGVPPPYGTQAATFALGLALFAALLLAAHGFPGAASVGLAGACLLDTLALGLAQAVSLSGGPGPGRPLEWVVTAYGPAVVPLFSCAVVALALLTHGARVLAGASAHVRERW